MDKVASGFRLKKKTHEDFNLWINHLPIPMKKSYKEKLWEDCSDCSQIIWTERGGFILYF
jgi:hypothetical protein